MFSTWNGLTNSWSNVYEIINLVWMTFNSISKLGSRINIWISLLGKINKRHAWYNLSLMSVSSHFGNSVFGCFLATKLPKYYVIVCLFFILSCPSCLANKKHCTKNQKWTYQNIWWAGQTLQNIEQNMFTVHILIDKQSICQGSIISTFHVVVNLLFALSRRFVHSI